MRKLRANELAAFFFQKDIWRRMNFEGSSLPPGHNPHLALYMRRVDHVRGAQEIRWFNDQAIDDSPLYTEANLRDYYLKSSGSRNLLLYFIVNYILIYLPFSCWCRFSKWIDWCSNNCTIYLIIKLTINSYRIAIDFSNYYVQSVRLICVVYALFARVINTDILLIL